MEPSDLTKAGLPKKDDGGLPRFRKTRQAPKTVAGIIIGMPSTWQYNVAIDDPKGKTGSRLHRPAGKSEDLMNVKLDLGMHVRCRVDGSEITIMQAYNENRRVWLPKKERKYDLGRNSLPKSSVAPAVSRKFATRIGNPKV